MFRHALIWSTLLATALVSRSSEAQLAPTGTHYADRASDTGHTEPSEQGGYSASVPLELPPSHGGLPLPLQIVSGTRGFGAAGVGWDIPLSYVFDDRSFARRRPAATPTNGIGSRERVTVALLGRNLEMLQQGDGWIARNDPSVTMTSVDGAWQVVDASGVSYTFVKDVKLYSTGGPGFGDSGGLWLLYSIHGRGGAEVDLDYNISSLDSSPDAPLTIDLQDVKYNPDSSNTCFKHEIDLSYDTGEDGGLPQGFSLLGERVVTRLHKLDYVVVRSRASCTDAPIQLRAYELRYASNQDTQQQQLSTVLEHGREDIPGGTLPIATYHYGTASTISNGNVVLLYGAPDAIPLPPGSSAVVASTNKVSTSLFQPPIDGSPYAASQTLQDFNGDGRADFVYTTSAGKLEIADGQGALGFGSAVPLTDNSFTRNVLDTRTSSVDRFASETTTDDQVQDYVWTQSIDVNGDGRIDILDAAEKPDTWVVYLNTPDPGASGIKWVRRELPVKKLRQALAVHGLTLPTDYLPLSGRRTGRDLNYLFHWVWDGGQYVRATEIVGLPDHPTVILEPPVLINSGQEQTYTEFKVIDMNGDGYPDVVFNTAPVSTSPIVAPQAGQFLGYDYYRPQLVQFGPTLGNALAVAYNTAGLFVKSTGTYPFADESDAVGSSGCGVEWWSGDETAGDRIQDAKCMFVDVNGDGVLDRIEGNTVLLGTGFSFHAVPFHIPTEARRLFATQESKYIDQCPGANNTPVTQGIGLRDVTGDGIPDLVQHHGAGSSTEGYDVFVGTGAGFADIPIPVALAGETGGLASFMSEGRDRCDGSSSWTESGLYDVNGDGRPDLVGISGNNIVVRQLSGGSQPGSPEAGHLTGIDNGYGASIEVTYTSAKDDATTAHNVPFPEIVVSSIETKSSLSQSLGGSLAATKYAYGKIAMFYDSTLDVFRSAGYGRHIAVTTVGSFRGGAPISNARISDAYPLDPANPITFSFLSGPQRLGRYLEAGRLSDTTTLAGGLGVDPWALLTVDVTSDARRIAGTHYSIDTLDTHYYIDSSAPSDDVCVEMMFPYDFDLSQAYNVGVNPCNLRGFLYSRSTQSWRGSAAPPAMENVQVYTSVRSVDDYGRITSIFYQNDASQNDDDVCVDTTYATPTDPVVHVLTAPASKKVWACGDKGDGHTVAEESWEYDKQYAGLVFQGLPTSHTVYRHATDTGQFLGAIRQFDATYDALGNPIQVTTSRDDGAWRTTTIRYDAFGLTPTDTDTTGSDTTDRHASQTADPISGALVSSIDENGTIAGLTTDTFGRPLLSTVQQPGDTAPGVVSARTYLGFDGADLTNGRHISIETFSDPLPQGSVGTGLGRTTTVFFDELGRERFGQVRLGSDYNDTLVVNDHTYDAQGRTVFEADAYPLSQSAATAYGTSRFYAADGSVSAEIRGSGPQPLSTLVDPAHELFPTLYQHTFANHLETTSIQAADSLTSGSPQQGVTRQATSTAIGRVLSRATYQSATRLELAAFAYDLLGNQRLLVRAQDAVNGINSVSWAWQFDSLGQVLSLSEPLNATQSRTYDNWGDLTRIDWHPVSPEPSHSVVMTYDSLGRTLSSHEENNNVLDPLTVNTYSYDTAGTSAMITPTYVIGRLAKASSTMGDVVVSYDGLGNVNARSYTDLKDVTYVERQGLHADGSQAWVALQLPDNAYATERVDYDYDTANRLRWMWYSDGKNTTELYNAKELDVWGRLREGFFGPTELDANYFNVGRRLPTSVKAASPAGTRTINFAGFDALGRETSRDESVPTLSGHLVTGYDALGRLNWTVRTQGTVLKAQWGFSYDPLGNVTKLDDQLGTADASMTYLTTDRDRICAIAFAGTPTTCNVDYDSFGNVTAEPARMGDHNKLTYFNGGDVRTIANKGYTAKFAYDPFGEVEDVDIRNTSSEVRHDHNFGEFITQRSQVVKNDRTSYVARNFPGPGLTISRRGPAGNWIYQFSDSQGTRFTTDDKGNFIQDLQYTPFGEPTSTGAVAGSPNFTPDQWNDGNALDGFALLKVGKRIYDPTIGRFLSRDPLLIPRTAATTNPYAFAMNDPTNLSDPSGMDPCAQFANCSITTSVGGYSDAGPIGTIAAIGALMASYLFATGVNPGLPVAAPTMPELATYSAAFDTRMAMFADWHQSESDFAQFKSEVEDELPSNIWLVHSVSERFQTVGIDVSWFVKRTLNNLASLPERIVAQTQRAESGEAPTAEDGRTSVDMLLLVTGVGEFNAAAGPSIGRLSNEGVRSWYSPRARAIDISGADTREVAEAVVNARNALKTEARSMMADRVAASKLDVARPIQPFEYYEAKYAAQGYSGEALWKRIKEGSTTPNEAVNAVYGVK